MLTDLTYPPTLEYSSDGLNLPIEFFMTAIPECKRIDLKLGYFSSNAIRTLAYGFAQFIRNGGIIRIITNHYLSFKDKLLISDEDTSTITDEEAEYLINKDLEGLAKILESGDQHFFDCLKYLLKYDRLQIIPVKLKPNRLSHFKQGIFDDGTNQVYFNGSCNFTYRGLIDNGESLSIARSWGESSERLKVKENNELINKVCNKEDIGFEYLNADQIIAVIEKTGRDKQLDELIEEEINIYERLSHLPYLKKSFSKYAAVFKKKVEDERKHPRFPYPEGPRDYQVEAYQKWVANGKKGIFAMATGTGKTITALNCLLNEYKESGLVQSIILVPTNDLQRQWIKEIHKFNIKDIITVAIDSDWKNNISRLTTNFQFGRSKSFVVISTYVSFSRYTLQNFLRYFPKETLLIADEAHNIASPKVLEVLPSTLFVKRIGLSATPKRIYDGEGTEEMNKFFDDKPPYTYSFSMEEAIAKGILCQYEYHPHLVRLTKEELDEYKEITTKLSSFYNIESNSYKAEEIVTRLLLKRKRIIHKASNKIKVFKKILKQEFNKRKSLKYTFIYVPEGFDNNSIEEGRIIQQYNHAIMETDNQIRVSTFTGDNDDRGFVIKSFEEGNIDVLTAMKCLDEGIDIPRAELAIFCSSTGNPRQFIQRRGRILRQHIDKKYAVIHDLVVVPDNNSVDHQSENFNMERSQVENELKRVADFAFMARNQYEAIEQVRQICSFYDLNLFEINEKIK